jgi:hypothetical protein
LGGCLDSGLMQRVKRKGTDGGTISWIRPKRNAVKEGEVVPEVYEGDRCYIGFGKIAAVLPASEERGKKNVGIPAKSFLRLPAAAANARKETARSSSRPGCPAGTVTFREGL